MKSHSILAVLGVMASTSGCSLLPASSRLPCQQQQVDGAVRMEIHVVKTPSGCPVVFESYLPHRTEIEIFPGHTATIDQAPTNLVTTVFPTADVYNTRTIYMLGNGTEARQLTTTALQELQSGRTNIAVPPDTTAAAPLADETNHASISTLSKVSESPITVVVKKTITVPAAPATSAGTKAPVLEVVKDVILDTSSTVADQTEATSVYKVEFPAYTLPPLGGRKNAIRKTLKINLPASQPGKQVTEVFEISQQIIVPQENIERLLQTGLELAVTKLISAHDGQSDSSMGRALPSFQLVDIIRIPADAIPESAPNGLIIKVTERITVPKDYIERAKTGDTLIEIDESI
ncbi:hypothetical protein NLG97_g444 [Lecanicillium saksenae]|uniref:Uncharacterized protein n=1 Tax=Lecanicillium saksenae TaxID=468837 RepID=A0ACC1R6F3_9HYPO|nr:hypothetical protein NLG97_g444 [Lecanicillium saksenae]